MSKKNEDSKNFSKLVEDMFSPESLDLHKDSFFLSEGGLIVAGVKQNGALQNARLVDKNIDSTKSGLNSLAKTINKLKLGEMKLKEIPVSEYSKYGIVEQDGGVKKTKGRKPRKNKMEAGEPIPSTVEAGIPKRKNRRAVSGGVPEIPNDNFEDNEQKIKLSDFFKNVTKRAYDLTKDYMLQGGDPNDKYNPNFTIFKK